MSDIFSNALIEKKNVLNEIRSNNMTLQELRFFSIYLSKINARDVSTRVVKFSLSDFQKIMDFGRLNIKQLQLSTNSLLCKVVNVPDGHGGYTGFTLFKRCKVFKDNFDEWFIEIDASDDALSLMFDFKERYFTYELWNALRLKSANQVRMYEILKQYEKLGKREITIKELRELLGIAHDEYPRWERFRVRVLDSCQQSLKENTDICFTYERGKMGNGGKWLTIIFHIQKNSEYVDQLTLDNFISQQTISVMNNSENNEVEYSIDDKLGLLSEAVENEFTTTQMNEIFQTICLIHLPNSEDLGIDIARYHYLAQKYAKLNSSDERNKLMGKRIKNRFNYFLKLIQSDITNKQNLNENIVSEQSYDIDKFDQLAVTFSKNTKK